MDIVIQFLPEIGLVIMVVLLFPCAFRALIGPSGADRLQAVDTMTTLLIGIIVLLALVQKSYWLVDIGVALAAFGFIGTLALARYLSDGRVF